MKILVIRKGWDVTSEIVMNEVNVKHIKRAKLFINFEFARGATFNPDDFSIIFLHLNNEEASKFLEEFNKNVGNKIIIFSTSNETPDELSYKWSQGYPFLGGMDGWNAFRILNWQNVKIGMSANELVEALKPKEKKHLIALSILCQGYVAAHGGQGLGEEWVKCIETNPRLKRMIEGKINDTENKCTYWKQVIGDSEKEVKDELNNIPEGKDEKQDVGFLIEAIYGKNNELLDASIVEKAYIALKLILKG